MNSDRDLPCGRGCPIRRSRDHRSLASPPGFSQRATSFIASQCQGIHQMPFSALDPGVSDCGGSKLPRETPSTPPRTGAKPCSPQTCPRESGEWGAGPRETCPCESRERGPMHMAASHEDTSSGTRAALCRKACPPRSHDKLSLHPSNNIPPGFPDDVSSNFSERRRSTAAKVNGCGGGGARWWR